MVEREPCSIEFAKSVVLDFMGNSETFSVLCALARPQRKALISDLSFSKQPGVKLVKYGIQQNELLLY